MDLQLGRILVLPVLPLKETCSSKDGECQEDDPVMLVALNAKESVEWDELRIKAKELVYHLEKPVNQLRGRLASSARVVSNPRHAAVKSPKTR